MTKIYTVGKITGDPNWQAKFQAVKEKYESLGFEVLSPLDHPAGLEYEDYMKLSMDYVFDADGIVMLPDWRDSPGAVAEIGLAQAINTHGKPKPYIEDGTGYDEKFMEYFGMEVPA